MRLNVIRNLGSGGFGTVDLVKGADGLEYARKTFCPAQPLTPAIEENVKKRFAREAEFSPASSTETLCQSFTPSLTKILPIT